MINAKYYLLKGVSVLEMVHAFEEASGVKIPVEMADRREGDVAASYATCDLAYKELGFKCKYTLYDMCKSPQIYIIIFRNFISKAVIKFVIHLCTKYNNLLIFYITGKDTWTWQSKNPKGFVE